MKTDMSPIAFLGGEIIIGNADFKRAYEAVVRYFAHVGSALNNESLYALSADTQPWPVLDLEGRP